MNYDDFQVAVIELASTGTRITVANVVAELRIDPKRTEPWLDQMARDGRLDLEVDDREGVVFYRVRGLTPRARPRPHEGISAVMGAVEFAQLARRFGHHGGHAISPGHARDVRVGALLGGLFPGLGLAYAAPWSVVALATVVVWLGFKLFAALSLFFFGLPFIIAAAATSAVLGAVYTHRFNQEGHRAALLEEESPRLRR